MEEKRTCKDCFNCKTKITFKVNRGKSFTKNNVYLPSNPVLEYILNKIIVFGRVRCSKGMWEETVKGGEKFYKNLIGFISRPPKLLDANKCPEFDGEF